MRRKVAFAAIAVFAVLVVAGWFAHKPLLARYYVRQLRGVDEKGAAECSERIVALGDAAQPRLIELLRRDDPGCRRAGAALARILEKYSENDPRAAEIAERLVSEFAHFTPQGKQAALELIEPLLAKGGSKDACRTIVRAALKDTCGTTREFAIPLAVRSDLALEPEVPPLLHDPEAAVRRSALLAVGSSRDLLADDNLLPWLHDPDAEVRGLCEAALRARGLRDQDVLLGRLLTDASPFKRLQVIDFLPNDNQLDPHAWLQRLSQDPVPAVRAGAARAGLDPEYRLGIDFSARVRQMAESDPDGTVRQIAVDLLKTLATGH